MFIRPKLKDVCDVVVAMNRWPLYLKLTESGGFEVLGFYTEGAVEIMGGNLRKSVRKALDLLENNIHERRRETIRLTKEEE